MALVANGLTRGPLGRPVGLRMAENPQRTTLLRNEDRRSHYRLCMDWPGFWTAFFGSSGAAFVAFGTTAWVYTRTRAAERRGADERGRQERVAAVRAAAWGGLTTAAARRWVPIGAAAPVRFVNAVAELLVAEFTVEPAVVLWAEEQMTPFTEALRAAERGWLLPGDMGRRAKVVALASEVATRLAGWERGAIPATWFAEHLSENGKVQLAEGSSDTRNHSRGLRRL